MTLTKKQLSNLRKLVRAQRSFDLYNIMAVIRGPDDQSHRDLKIVTAAIRAYIGFKNNANCSGWCTLGNWQKDELVGALEKVERGYGHYAGHLIYALNTIGRKNLIEFVEKLKV